MLPAPFLLREAKPILSRSNLSCQNPLAMPPAAERILVIRLGAVGDVVRTLPAVSALRAGYPQARITWLVENASSSLLRGQPWIDELLVFPRETLSAALRELRLGAACKTVHEVRQALGERRFDLAVDFHSILKSALLARLSAAPRRVAYAAPFGREVSWCFATELARLSSTKGSRFDRNLALVRFLGLQTNPDPRPLRIEAERIARVQAQLGLCREVQALSANEQHEPSAASVAASSGWQSNTPRNAGMPIVIHAGTSAHTAHKRYTREGYAAVARALAQAGHRIVLSFGPAAEEQRFAASIVALAQGAAELAPVTPSLLDLAALFSCARLYIGSDTGPMHVASLMGTPVVQLIGPTDIVENEPWRETPFRTVQAPLQSAATWPRLRRRRQEPGRRMDGIAPERILAAAQELLAEQSAR